MAENRHQSRVHLAFASDSSFLHSLLLPILSCPCFPQSSSKGWSPFRLKINFTTSWPWNFSPPRGRYCRFSRRTIYRGRVVNVCDCVCVRSPKRPVPCQGRFVENAHPSSTRTTFTLFMTLAYFIRRSNLSISCNAVLRVYVSRSLGSWVWKFGEKHVIRLEKYEILYKKCNTMSDK